MTEIVLDTSVAIAWYLPETFSAQARGWQRRFLDGSVQPIVPSLHFWEFGNVLRTKVRRRELSRDLAREINEAHLDAPLVVSDPDRKAVLETAFAYGSTVYDAVYIAIALELDLKLVTAERSTAAWVAKLGERAATLGTAEA